MKINEKRDELASTEKANDIFKSYSIVWTEKDMGRDKKGTKIWDMKT